VTGEGGSGGALAIAVGDRVNMLEHAVYSVISPEGCASILFRDSSRAEEAAIAMKITAADLAAIELIDEVIPEPPGGAHVDHDALFKAVDAVLWRQLGELRKLPPEKLPELRYAKFRAWAAWARVPGAGTMTVHTVGLVGGGIMGQGIAVTCAAAGLDVLLLEKTPELARNSVREIGQALERDIAKWRRTESEKKAILGRIQSVDEIASLGPASIVIECVSEDLELKGSIFRRLDEACPPASVLASNTSSLSITEIATRTQRPERVIGLHFLQPVPSVPLVEVVRGLGTADATFRAALDFVRLLGKTGIEVFEFRATSRHG